MIVLAASTATSGLQVGENFSQLLSIVRSERRLIGGICDSDPLSMEADNDGSNASLVEDVYLEGSLPQLGVHHPNLYCSSASSPGPGGRGV